MRRAILWCAWGGLALTLLVGCRPAIQEELGLATFPPPLRATATPLPQTTRQPTPAQPNTPTPPPTVTTPAEIILPENWQEVGEVALGLSLAAPATWVDIGRLENIVSLTSKLQQSRMLFLANEVRTGVQVMTGREVTDGAFTIAFQAAESLPATLDLGNTTDPVAGLETILARNQVSTAEVRPIRLNNFPGAYVDITADPTGILFSPQQQLKLRMALFIKPETGIPTFIFMGASESQWAQYSPIFDYMLETVLIYDQSTGLAEGMRFLDTSAAANNRSVVTGQLTKDKMDFWIFAAQAGQYASITVTPKSNNRDLTINLLTPSGRTIAQQDNGYAGDAETLVDVLLPEAGSYMIQISEFFNEPEMYTLEVSLSDVPLYGEGGRIEINQSIEATLRPGGEDEWMFAGQIGQIISIVLSPGAPFDAVFSLYAPDGSRIATFDEGYSGDAEILALYTLPITGDYRIVVKSFGENGGQYTLAVDEGNEDVSNYYEAGDLPYGNTQRETFHEDEVHAWYITGLAGDEIALEARPIDGYLDLDLWLLDPEARRLVMHDEALAGESERISYVLPRDGIYIVVVQDFFGEAGEYEMSLTVSGKNYLVAGGALSYDQTADAELLLGRGTIWYFNGEVGDIINLTLQPQESDTSDLVLSLRNPANEPIIQVDEALAGGDESLLAFQLDSSGTWAIVVQEYFDGGGTYSLTLTKQ